MKLSYPLTQLLAVAGAFVVVTTFAFSSSASTAIDFAISIGATLVGLAIARSTNLAIGLGTAVVGTWSILVTAGIFSGSTQRWLDFAAGVAFAAAGVVAGALIERSNRRTLVAPAGVASSNGYRVAEQDRVAA
jgi:hypothetical protein